jgi:hypothetical protein
MTAKIKIGKNVKVKNFLVGEDNYSNIDETISRLTKISEEKIKTVPFDFEVSEFKPLSNIIYNIYFSLYRTDINNDDISNLMNERFNEYISSLKNILVNVDIYPNLTNTVQDIGIVTPTNMFNQISIDESKLVVQDNVLASIKPFPSEIGYPMYYNSFILPYINDINNIKDDGGINTQNYLYGSYIRLEYFDSDNLNNQNKIFENKIYITNRNLKNEETINGTIQKLPVMEINDTMSGHSFFWPDNHITDLYIRYSFYNALTGKILPLVPGNKYVSNIKWVQNSENFNYKNLYSKLNMNNSDYSYSIKLYDGIGYNIEANNIDLYQLIFDKFYSKVPVTSPDPIIYKPKNILETTITKTDVIGLTASTELISKSISGSYNTLTGSSSITDNITEELLIGGVKYSILYNKKIEIDSIIIKNISKINYIFKEIRIKESDIYNPTEKDLGELINVQTVETSNWDEKIKKYNKISFLSYELPDTYNNDYFPLDANKLLVGLNKVVNGKLVSTRDVSVILDMGVEGYSETFKPENTLIFKPVIMLGKLVYDYILNVYKPIKIEQTIEIDFKNLSNNKTETVVIPLKLEIKHDIIWPRY